MASNPKKRGVPPDAQGLNYVLDLRPLANRVVGQDVKSTKPRVAVSPDYQIDLRLVFKPMTLSADANKLLAATIASMNQTMELVEIAAKPRPPSKPKQGPKQAPAKKVPAKKAAAKKTPTPPKPKS